MIYPPTWHCRCTAAQEARDKAAEELQEAEQGVEAATRELAGGCIWRVRRRAHMGGSRCKHTHHWWSMFVEQKQLGR